MQTCWLQERVTRERYLEEQKRQKEQAEHEAALLRQQASLST